MISLYYNRTFAMDYGALLNDFPDEELPKFTRSTVPLLAY